MHSKVLSMLPNDWYLMNATGVLGLVPQDLWSCMPWYDSGIPNRWRVQTTAFSYFKKFPHDKIVVFGDFYNQALEIAFQLLGIMDQVTFVNEVKFYYNYIDLLDPERLKKLEEALQ
jgi:hypothetical protein